MSPSTTRLYLLLAIACLAGYTWLYIAFTYTHLAEGNMAVCFIKHSTGFPCPSCGATRSVLAIMKGQLQEAFYLNPLGYLITIIMLITPPWIIADVARKRDSLFTFYHAIEARLRQPAYAIPLVLLVLLNWFWNIKKGI